MFIIGIVGRAYQNKDSQNIIQTHEATRRFLAKRKDIVCITLLPTEDEDYITLTPGEDKIDIQKLDFILDKCDAFIVPGGTYGYNFDEYVIKYAIEKDKPLLAICLGFQIMCSMFAPNRTRFDMTEKNKSDNHHGDPNEYMHKVILKDNTILQTILKEKEINVNSVHNDIINFIPQTLTVNAISEDGVIEGVEYPNKKFIVGLQWHPEYLKDDNSEKIINKMIDAINSK